MNKDFTLQLILVLFLNIFMFTIFPYLFLHNLFILMGLGNTSSILLSILLVLVYPRVNRELSIKILSYFNYYLAYIFSNGMCSAVVSSPEEFHSEVVSKIKEMEDSINHVDSGKK